ncbi:MAG: phosphoadenosine phosphosulfate reductase family protein [Firmicutes bacterium]|nr:phosphoadenosine phosphosulfate reductase family protein [Bacillota bacterium]
MLTYGWDKITGGIILQEPNVPGMKEEVFPVYAEELTTLGFGRYFEYKEDNSRPYMWTINDFNDYVYFYRGEKVAIAKGREGERLPELEITCGHEILDGTLEQIDVEEMCRKNAPIIDKIANETIETIRQVYDEYKDRIDDFAVAYSAGKDSSLLLDLVMRALPPDAYRVVFHDSRMESKYTLEHWEETRQMLNNLGIRTDITVSEFDPEEMWRKFGPPASGSRWCCSVFKTSASVFADRKKNGNKPVTTMTMTGLRRKESSARAGRDMVSYGKKHAGVWTFNPVIEWSSAELFLYLYSRKIRLNEAYIKGKRRIGCTICPCAPTFVTGLDRIVLKGGYENLRQVISDSYSEAIPDEEERERYVESGLWMRRFRYGSVPINQKTGFRSSYDADGDCVIYIEKERTPWRTWIKTIGNLTGEGPEYSVLFRNKTYVIRVDEKYRDDRTGNTYDLKVTYSRKYKYFGQDFVKAFESVFHKVSSCVFCRTCEADCPNNFLHMKDGVFTIDDQCTKCMSCHMMAKGCLRYHNLHRPIGNEEDRYPIGSICDTELLNDVITNGTPFVEDKGAYSDLPEECRWEIAMADLAVFPFMRWYTSSFKPGECIDRTSFMETVLRCGGNSDIAEKAWRIATELAGTSLGEAGFGKLSGDCIIRQETNPNPLSILYAYYTIQAGDMGHNYFSYNYLRETFFNGNTPSPMGIFSISEDKLKESTRELADKYPEFILIKRDRVIHLKKDKTLSDVLKLFAADKYTPVQEKDAEVTEEMFETANCKVCGALINDSDIIGLNRKLIDEDATEFLCLNCMAKEFACTADDLEEKIEEFKEEGCKLFK